MNVNVSDLPLGYIELNLKKSILYPIVRTFFRKGQTIKQ